jgi:hypothetical protein
MHSYFTMTFPSFPFTTLMHPSIQFNSLHFAAFWMIFPPHLHFDLFITFLTLFLKLLDLQERAPKVSAGSWFQSWMVLFTEEY